MPTPGTALWMVGAGIVVWGLVSVLRYRIVLGAFLMMVGMAVGLVAALIVN